MTLYCNDLNGTLSAPVMLPGKEAENIVYGTVKFLRWLGTEALHGSMVSAPANVLAIIYS